MTKTVLIHGEMLIGEILNRFPDAAEIMEDFGLHCTSCSVNAFEPLKLGAMSHGLAEEVVDDMIERLNELALSKHQAPLDGIYVTDRAARKIKEFAIAEKKDGFGLRVTAKDNDGMEPAYGMDFEESAKEDDTDFEFHGVQIFLDPESAKNMMGAEIDYLETQFGSGFKITNPQFMGEKGGCCGGSNSGCGGGNCGSNGGGGCGSGSCGCS